MKTEISIDDLLALSRTIPETGKGYFPEIYVHTPRKAQFLELASALEEKGVKKNPWIKYKDDSTIWEEFGQDTAVRIAAYEYTNDNYLTKIRMKNDYDASQKETFPNPIKLYEFDDISDYKIKGGQNGTD